MDQRLPRLFLLSQIQTVALLAVVAVVVQEFGAQRMVDGKQPEGISVMMGALFIRELLRAVDVLSILQALMGVRMVVLRWQLVVALQRVKFPRRIIMASVTARRTRESLFIRRVNLKLEGSYGLTE